MPYLVFLEIYRTPAGQAWGGKVMGEALKGTVLIVDDAEDIRNTLGMFLEHAGLDVLQAKDGLVASEILEETPVDVVVTDVIMPERTGVDLLARAREQSIGTQFILISGMPCIETATQAVRLSAFDYLQKPVLGSDLLDVVRAALLRKRETEELKREREEFKETIDALALENRSRAEELNRSIARYRELVDGLQIAAFEIDVSSMRLIHISGGLVARLVGSAESGPFDWNLEDRMDEDGAREFRVLLERPPTTPGVVVGPLRVTGADGSDLFVECLASIDAPSGPGRFAGVFVDVTARKLAEDAHEHMAEELGRARDKLRRRLLRGLDAEQSIPPPIRVSSKPSGADIPVFFGESPAIRDARHITQLATRHLEPVLLHGETGTGKGMFAEWIHRHSGMREGAFVSVNCACLRGDLLLSELFGHARGAFTSAERERKGLVEEAHKGTLFLDEIAEMDMAAQSQLLKVIEDKSFRRVGETRVRKSDFRLICATNRDITSLAAGGALRSDLLYRINLLTVDLPPLRERLEDLLPLCRHLLEELGADNVTLGEETLDFLAAQPWPGNIRQLRGALVRALLLNRTGHLTPSDFVLQPNPGVPPFEPSTEASPSGTEEEQIRALLQRFDGNKSKVARALGMSRSWLYRKLAQYGLDTAE